MQAGQLDQGGRGLPPPGTPELVPLDRVDQVLEHEDEPAGLRLELAVVAAGDPGPDLAGHLPVEPHLDLVGPGHQAGDRLCSSAEANLATTDLPVAPPRRSAIRSRTVSAIWPVPTGSMANDSTDSPTRGSRSGQHGGQPGGREVLGAAAPVGGVVIASLRRGDARRRRRRRPPPVDHHLDHRLVPIVELGPQGPGHHRVLQVEGADVGQLEDLFVARAADRRASNRPSGTRPRS